MSRPGGNETHEAWLAALLAWVAGFVDAVGYLVLGQLFVANMTGNTVGMAANLAQREWAAAWHRGFLIPVFVVGAALGAAVIEAAHRRRFRSAHAAAFGLETALLLAFALIAQPQLRDGALGADAQFYPLAALPTLAMGLQSTSFRRVGSSRLRTPYISGILTALAEEAVFVLIRWAGRAPETAPGGGTSAARAHGRALPSRVLLPAGLWTAYALGALLGAFLEQHWALRALTLPIGVLIAVAAWDLIQPDTPVREEGASARPR